MLLHWTDLILRLATEHNIYFKKIVADAVSDVGAHLLSEMGFSFIKPSSHESKIMTLDLFLEQELHSKFKKQFLAIYKAYCKREEASNVVEKMMQSMLFKYDLFISYASENKDIADYIVDKIEKRGYKCFIAPRDIRTGSEYAVEIIREISNSTAVLLVFPANQTSLIMFSEKSILRFRVTVRLFLSE